MKSKIILPIVLAAFSCLPSVSASEKQDSNNTTKSDSTNRKGTMSPLAAGSIGFVAGAGIAGLSSGLGVRHFKNKEIETEKSNAQNDINDLKQQIKQLEQERDTLKQENEKFKSKLTELKNKVPEFKDMTDSEAIDLLFKCVYAYSKANRLYSKFIGYLNSNQKTLSTLLNGNYPFGWDDDSACSYLDMMGHPETLDHLTVGYEVQYAHVTRCLLGILEVMHDDDPDPSTLIEENYLFENAKDKEEDMILKPKLSQVE